MEEENKEEENKVEELAQNVLDHERLITVFKTGHPGVAFVVKSILDEAEIKYLIKNEGVQALFGVGTIGTGFNPITGPVTFQVMPEDEEEAKELLKDVSETPDEEETPEV